ncbi:MAG: site-specific integrase [Mycolicibacterium sp.]|uniref:site-specific integrase n=1 Tax=Mycolicibacterium sp. TaxID=2320850 RepID=UPI000F989173|nr:site-specific integrase [Mycolicibacterium sp.]RUP26395.1 MAG: site-specific integrase [Mycolicibacterium sp.]
MDSTVSARTGHSTIAAVSSEPGIVSLSFDQRYEAVSQAFPPWLLSDPIVFPGDHRTYGWACQVPDCNGELAGSNIKFLCSTHDHEFKALSSKLTIEEFAKQATPSPCILRGWARYRLDDCRICGPNREALITGLCMAHNRILWKAKRRGETEEACLRAQTPFPPLPRCAIPDCVHDGPLFNFRGPGQVRVCKSHYQVWRSYLRDNNLSPDEALWTEWAAMEPRSKRMQLPENRGDVWVDHLPLRLQREIRYAIHRHDSTARRGHWRPRHIQVVVDVLASEGVQTLNDPMLAEHVSKYKAADVRRIWADLPIAARGLTLTRQDAKYAGWFDPAIVGAKQFKSANSPSDRRMVWDLTGISQRWLRDLLWENLEYAATESPQPTSGTINRRVRSIHLLSKALWQLREDHGNDPELLHASDARAFKDLWDMWYREQVPVAENRTFNSPVPKPLVELVYKTSPNAMHAVLVFGRARNLGPTDSFVLAFPRYSAPEERPKPRPISDDDFRLLISDASLKLLDESDVNDVGLVDIWLTHAFQGGRISETIYLRLGCIGMIGEAQPYLWRDITKANVLDYGMPCHYPVYQRLLRRQEVTRAKLRRRYAADLASLNKRQRAALEAEWDRTMPLFPGPTTNPDLRLPVSSSVLQRKLADWIEKLGLKGITTHRTRSTMATALLDNGAPPAGRVRDAV